MHKDLQHEYQHRGWPEHEPLKVKALYWKPLPKDIHRELSVVKPKDKNPAELDIYRHFAAIKTKIRKESKQN